MDFLQKMGRWLLVFSFILLVWIFLFQMDHVISKKFGEETPRTTKAVQGVFEAENFDRLDFGHGLLNHATKKRR